MNKVAEPTLDLEFIRIHHLVHQFDSSNRQETKTESALAALTLLDSLKILHPSFRELQSYLKAQNHPLADKYGVAWASSIENEASRELFLGDEYIGQSEKPEFFENFAPQFRRLFVGCDFPNLQIFLDKASLSVQFLNQCSDTARFTENRYFEFFFYQVIAIVYGSLWFPSVSRQDDLQQQNDEVSPASKLSQLEKKCDSYHRKSVKYLNNLNEQHPETIHKVHTEFQFYSLVKWYCAFAKFKEHRLTEFCSSFEDLQKELEILDLLGLRSEALLCYGIVSIAAKPFKSLDFHSNDQVLELFTFNNLVESSLYEVLRALSSAKFLEVKSLWQPELFSRLDLKIAYALPAKTKGTFWDYLLSIIDLKSFLLILSISKCISRSKMLDKLGYSAAPESTRAAVSNSLVLSMLVLDLSEVNVFYDENDDSFYNLPMTDEKRQIQLEEKLRELDHEANAEAAAAHMKTLLISKYFD